MSGERRLYTPEFLRACALHFTGATSLAFFLLFPLYVKGLGGTEVTIGLLLGFGTAASVGARPLVGMVLDRVGRRSVLVWCGIANVLSWIPFVFLTGIGPAVYVWTIVHDVVWGALFVAYFTYAADLVPPARRAEGIAMFGVAGMAANGIAPNVGEHLLDVGGWPVFFAAAMAAGTVSVLISLAVPAGRHRHVEGAPPSLRDVVRLAVNPHLVPVMLATALLGIAINAAYLFVAPYTRAVDVARAGPFFAAYSGMSVAIRLFGRRTLDVLGPHRVSGPAFAIFAIGLAALAALPAAGADHATLVLVGCGMACGAGHGALFPVLNAMALARGPAGRQGAVVGLQTAAIDAGAVFGMPFCGVLAERLGYPAMFETMALACLAGLVLMARDARVSEGAKRPGG